MILTNSSTKYKPNVVSPPGETLQDLLEQHNLSQADLAERMGRPKKTINEIVQGKTAITPETALQLQLVLKVPAHFWLSREAQYRAWLAEQDDDNRLRPQLERLKDLPVKQMILHRWIQKKDDQLSQLKEVLSFFGVTSLDRIPLTEAVAFRRSEAYASNAWALAAWLRKGIIDATQQQCKSFNKERLLSSLPEMRKLTTEKPQVFVRQLKTLCNSCGIAVAFTRELPKTNVCGATKWIRSDLALLQLSLRYRSSDHFWFSFFHELAHIALGHAKREILLEDSSGESLDHREVDADKFAQEQLIPPAQFQKLLNGQHTAASIRAFANSIGIAPGIVVGRLQHDKIIGCQELNSLKIPLSWEDWPSDET
jgi:addiction module HigA family antidote